MAIALSTSGSYDSWKQMNPAAQCQMLGTIRRTVNHKYGVSLQVWYDADNDLVHVAPFPSSTDTVSS